MDIPVLVMGFNRPDLLKKCLNSLIMHKVEMLYIALDGPRNSSEAKICSEVLSIAKEFLNHSNVKILTRTQNLGCYLGVISNLDWFFSQVPFGIVIEDDCTVQIEFFDEVESYRNNLEIYLDQKIGMISAHNPFQYTQGGAITEYSLIQGWAISSKVWNEVRSQLFKLNLPVLRRASKRSFWENIYWWANSSRAKVGGVDTWDGVFSYAMFRLGYRCLIPEHNRVMNFGFGIGATHTIDPNGSILISNSPTNIHKDQYDTMLRKHYFKLKPRLFFSSLFRLLIDFLRHRKRNQYEYVLNQDVTTRLFI